MARSSGELISSFSQCRPDNGGARPGPVAKRAPAETLVASVEALDDSGCGIVTTGPAPLLVDGALPGERIVCRRRRGRRHRGRADLVEVLQPSALRAVPVCPHFGLCGGCRLQHMPVQSQLEWKQEALRRAFVEHARLEPEHFLKPLTGPTSGYRRRARLGVKYVPGKGGALVGFREKHGAKLAELEACATLDARVGKEIKNLRDLINKLDGRRRIPQLEVAMGDDATALVLRHLDALSNDDRARLTEFVRERGWQLYLQPGGADSVHAVWPRDPPPLRYCLPDFDLELEFRPLDFVQINAAMNRTLVAAAVDHLGPRAESRVLDLFCGIGNFSLAVARRGGQVTGLEGDPGLVSRATRNARRNGIANAAFVQADLFDDELCSHWCGQSWDGVVLDPPRTGAARALASLRDPLPERIVYVSCNPRTLAVDAGLLVHGKGYRLRAAGVVDMFPHTGHCEAMAVFHRS